MASKEDNKFCSKSSWGARHVLVSMCFFMGVLLYSLRFNISIGIVAMVNDRGAAGNKLDFAGNNSSLGMCASTFTRDKINSNQSNKSPNASIELPVPNLLANDGKDNESKNINNSPTFDWDERDQGIILGSFFWGYVISQVPGGLLARRYGGKWVISIGMLFTGLLSVALPHAAILGGRNLVIAVRVLQGLGEGFTIPALVNLLSKWSPPEERARLCAMSFAGLPFGTAITMLISGQMISEYGWKAVFYLPGFASIIFFILWTWLIHDSPEKHPNIHEMELKYIKDSLSGATDNESSNPDKHMHIQEESVSFTDMPWGKIGLSLPFWSVLISQFCNAWSHNMLKSEGPKYLHSALNFDIHENGYIASLPFFLQMIFSLLTGRISDLLVERKVISMIFARRLCNTIGQWGIALTFAGIVMSGCNRLPAVIFYVFSGMISGAMNSGAYVNVIDISPRYSCVLEGVINGCANFAGFGAPYLAGMILHNQPTITGWAYVFLAPVALNVIGNLVFLCGSSVKVQPWNDSFNTENKDKTQDQI